jgi:hypothetical protein
MEINSWYVESIGLMSRFLARNITRADHFSDATSWNETSTHKNAAPWGGIVIERQSTDVGEPPLR